MVEVKAPMFTAAAWQVVASLLLSRMDSSMLECSPMLDLIWCSFVDRFLGKCECAACALMNATYHRERKCATTCAVSYATPLYLSLIHI